MTSIKPFGKLILAVPDGLPQEFILTQPIITIGSADINDIVIRQSQVSRTHARIECSDLGCTIYDLGSQRGTIVNNRKVTQANLVSQDAIQLGEAVLRFESLAIYNVADATVVDTAIFDTGSAEAPAADGPPIGPRAAAATEALVELQPGGAKPPFFCVVSRYLDAPLFGNLARALGPDQPFYLLQPTRLADSRTAGGSAQALAGQYVAAIRSVRAQGPYRLGGYNIGGILAFEMAQQLLSAGESVAPLVLLDTPFFSANPFPDLSFRSAQAINGALNLAVRPFEQLLRTGVGQQIARSSQVVKDTLDARLPRSARRLEEDYMTFQATLTDQAYAINLSAIKAYKPQAYPGRINLFLAEDSPVRHITAPLSWHQVALHGLDVRLISGNYLDIIREPGVRQLADQLRALLAS
jgi:thioesterase domain-containing protein